MGDESNIKEDTLYLGFIKLVGEEAVDGLLRYEFIFTDNIDDFWGDEFSVKPCCLSNNIAPNDEYISSIEIVRTKIKFDLAQESCCFCFQDCIDDCVALASENIDEYSEYPEEGRLVFHFGDTFDDVSRKLAMKNILMMKNKWE